MPLKLYTLSPAHSITEHLIADLLQQTQHDHLLLAQYQILLPSRRAVRKFKHQLLEKAPTSTIFLPKIQAISDLAAPLDTPILPEIPPTLRFGLLHNLIQKEGGTFKISNSIELTKQLCAFLDRLQTEEATLTLLETLVPENFAQHWQLTLQFFTFLEQKWAKLLQERGYLEPAMRRRAIWDATAVLWQINPPTYPIIAAGISGNIPAVGRLLKTIAQLPQGQVILPGFDTTLSPLEWQKLQPTHPQYLYKLFLAQNQLDPSVVQHLPACQKQLPPHTPNTVKLIELPTQQAEAESIAMLVRQALSEESKTIAIVSHDRRLSQRIRTELRRWDIEIDDSAGTTLAQTPLGQFFLLTATLKSFTTDPNLVLAILKHPLTHLNLSRKELLKYVRSFEVQVLRAVKDVSDLTLPLQERIRQRCDYQVQEKLIALINEWEHVTAPFYALLQKPYNSFQTLLQQHIQLIEELAPKNEIWQSDIGQTFASFLERLLKDAPAFDQIATVTYPYLLKTLLEDVVYHFPFSHPRVTLLAPSEARLLEADLVILAGLNEGTWPNFVSTNPWLNRSMQVAIGLREPEAYIGQQAHDFSMACAHKDVMLTRSQQIEGMPTIPSRWLLQLKTSTQDLTFSQPLQAWRHLLDHPPTSIKLQEPVVCPPLSARPQRISVSDVELLLKDSYEFYAKRILRLYPLDTLELAFTPRLFGIWFHRVLEHNPTSKELRAFLFPDHLDPLWRYQFEQTKAWLLRQEAFTVQPLTETSFSSFFHGIELIGKIDRLHIYEQGFEVIDYKTGHLPSPKELKTGNAPQLPLLALLAQQSLAKDPLKLCYWDLKNLKIQANDPDALIPLYQDILEKLLSTYQNEETQFSTNPARSSQYSHLERAQEWLNNIR